jgi:DNA-binding transcriptional LysR family regulator
LNDLDAFLRVVRAGSLTGAAKALDVPVSSVSRRLARLEEQLGVRLVHRTTRSLRLTETGEAFHERVARSFAEVEQAHKDLVAQGDVPRGRVRVSGPADMTTLGGAIAVFMCKYPDVQVELDLSNRFVDLVAEGFDLALRASSFADSSLVAHKITTSTVRIVGSPAYFERHGLPTSVEDLQNHRAVAFGTQAGQIVWPLTVNGRPVRATIPARLAVNNVVAAKNAALSGAVLTRLPQLVMDREMREGLLREVLPETAVETSTVALVYPSRRLVAPAVRALIEHLRSYYRDNPLS